MTLPMREQGGGGVGVVERPRTASLVLSPLPSKETRRP